MWYFKHSILDVVIASVMALALIELFSTEFTGRSASLLDVAAVDYTSDLFNNLYLYGVFFYNNWYIPFLAAAVVLLVAMLGSIILTTRLVVVADEVVTRSRTFSFLGFFLGFLLVAALSYFMSSDVNTVLCEAAPDSNKVVVDTKEVKPVTYMDQETFDKTIAQLNKANTHY